MSRVSPRLYSFQITALSHSLEPELKTQKCNRNCSVIHQLFDSLECLAFMNRNYCDLQYFVWSEKDGVWPTSYGEKNLLVEVYL